MNLFKESLKFDDVMQRLNCQNSVIAAHRHSRHDRPNRVDRIEPAIVFADEGRQANVKVLTQLVLENVLSDY